MNVFIDLVLPVVMGAGIGYLTNDIAIRMLFRPLTEKRVLGIRVPFTPGILPKNRKRLSASIAETVATQLLNADLVGARLATPAFRSSLAAEVSRSVDALLDAKISSLLAALDDDTRSRLKAAIDRAWAGISARRNDGEGDSLLRSFVRDLVYSIYPEAFRMVMGYAGGDGARAYFASQGRSILRKAIERLNAFQRFVVSAARYDSVLDDKMDETVDDLVRAFADAGKGDETRALVATSLADWFLGDGPGGNGSDTESKRRIAAAFAGQLSGFLADRGDESLGTILDLGRSERDAVSAWLSEKAADLISHKAGEIVAAVDIRSVVTEKLDSMDMLELENIVLGVMKEQFVWINVFGAILGGLIGLGQALIGVLR